MAKAKKSHSKKIGRASKACAGKGKRARKACMKAYFKKH